MSRLTFADCAAMLRSNGYAPAAARNGHVDGPHIIMQIDWAKHARPGDDCALLCLLGPARSPQPHVIADASSTWLARVSVSVSGPAAADVLAAVEHIAPGALVRSAGGSHMFLFRTAALLPALAARASYNSDTVRVDQSPAVLGSPDDWRDGVTPLDVVRSSLPELTPNGARALIAAAKGAFSKHAPAFVDPYTPPPKFVPAAVKLERGNHEQVVAALVENGYYCTGSTWGDEPSAAARRRGEPVGAPAVAVYLRAPTTSRFSFAPTAEDHRETWLCAVTVSGSGAETFADAIDAIVRQYSGEGKRLVRQNADGSTTQLFQHDAERGDAFAPLTLSRSKMDGVMHVPGTLVALEIRAKERAITVLGADGAWRDETPLTVRRDELPVLDRNRAESLLLAFERFMAEPHSAPGIVERVKRAVRR